MSETQNLQLPYIQAAQSQKHITHNQALLILDSIVQLSVIDQTHIEPPLNPQNGDRYIIASGAVNDWLGQDHAVASWQDNSWHFFSAQPGWKAWIINEDKFVVWNGSGWIYCPVSSSEIQNIGQIGINTTADSTNKFSVTSPNILFNNEIGDIRTVLNKAAPSDTASIVFQTAYSGHTELGCTGDNNFHVRTSSDGLSWQDSLKIQSDTGETVFHKPPSLPNHLISNLPSPSPSARLIYVNDATGGGVIAFSDGTNWKRIDDNTIVS